MCHPWHMCHVLITTNMDAEDCEVSQKVDALYKLLLYADYFMKKLVKQQTFELIR